MRLRQSETAIQLQLTTTSVPLSTSRDQGVLWLEFESYSYWVSYTVKDISWHTATLIFAASMSILYVSITVEGVSRWLWVRHSHSVLLLNSKWPTRPVTDWDRHLLTVSDWLTESESQSEIDDHGSDETQKSDSDCHSLTQSDSLSHSVSQTGAGGEWDWIIDSLAIGRAG